MKKHQIEKEIYETFNKHKPELFQSILEQCPDMEYKKTKESIFSRVMDLFSRRSFRYSFASFSLVLVLFVVLFNTNPTTTTKAHSRIAIEANPSILLELDEDDVVIAVVQSNEDAAIILGDMDLVGVDSNIAINAIIGSMVIHGYISEITNSVLLSVQSEDMQKENELLTTYTKIISDMLSNSAINGSVISQRLLYEKDAEDLADLLGISEAKAELILDIVEIDPRLDVNEIAKLSIHDLNLLLEAKNYAFDNINHSGSASTLGVIDTEDALQFALDYLNIFMTDVLEYDIELEQEDGALIYELDIETNDSSYEVKINAKNGDIVVSNDDDDEYQDDLIDDILSVQEVKTIIANTLQLNVSLMSEFEIEQEYENKIVFYDIAFVYGELEYELEVDAITGEIYYNSMDEDGYDYDHDDD